MKRWCATCLTALCSFVLAACGQKPAGDESRESSAAATAAVGATRFLQADKEPQNWLSHGRSYDEQRYSPLDQINTANVGKLGLAWTYKLDIDRAAEATPIVIDGVMYVTGAYSIVSALDATTGNELWKFDPKVPRDKDRDGCCDAANRGVAVLGNRVYVGAYDGRLIALNATTGAVVWKVDTVADHSRSYTISGAPRVVKGKVIIGNGGAELGVRGYITAYDAETGAQQWRFFTVPGDPALPPESKAMEMARRTWFGDRYWKFGGGGTVWDSMAYDSELDLLYIGVGNGAPWNRKVRSEGKGDNLFLSSIVALKPDTGEYVWHYQTTPGETWDFTATQHIVLADIEIGGVKRKVLMQAPKNGFFYVLDRATGELISADKYVPVNWATHVDVKTGRPVESPDGDWTMTPKLVTPGPVGGHNWQPMSYSPASGLVYIPAQEAPALYVPDHNPNWTGKGNWHTGATPGALPESLKELNDLQGLFKGRLIAWDPVARKEVWCRDYDQIWNGGTLSTGGGLVFQGTAEGQFIAYSADKGTQLWSAPANSGVMAGPVSYAVNGEQYIAVEAGWGGGVPLVLGALGKAKVRAEARVLAFKLGGTTSLPPPRSDLVALPKAADFQLDPEAIARGRDLYNARCGVCHGPSAIGGGVLPDLRYLTPEKHQMFAGIVAGAYIQRGMPGFMDVLKAGDVEDIHQYLIQRARDLERDAATPSASSAHAGAPSSVNVEAPSSDHTRAAANGT